MGGIATIAMRRIRVVYKSGRKEEQGARMFRFLFWAELAGACLGKASASKGLVSRPFEAGFTTTLPVFQCCQFCK